MRLTIPLPLPKPRPAVVGDVGQSQENSQTDPFHRKDASTETIIHVFSSCLSVNCCISSVENLPRNANQDLSNALKCRAVESLVRKMFNLYCSLTSCAVGGLSALARSRGIYRVISMLVIAKVIRFITPRLSIHAIPNSTAQVLQ